MFFSSKKKLVLVGLFIMDKLNRINGVSFPKIIILGGDILDFVRILANRTRMILVYLLQDTWFGFIGKLKKVVC